MRQPETVFISPSNPSPWYGAWAEGERFSGNQMAALARLGLDPAGIEAITVRRRANMREMWWPTGHPAPVFEFECPVLGRRADGKVRIISPAGMVKFVDADGWVRRESRRRK